MKFYYVYVLKSLIKDFIYVGLSTDLKTRVQKHNNKEELSTKAYAPFELIHYEAYRNQKDAKRRKGHFKTTKGKTTLKNYVKRIFLQRMAKLDLTSVSEIESGLRNPSLKTIYKISLALGVKLSEFA